MFLEEIEKPVVSLPGIGPGTAGILAGMGITAVRDLLRHYPRSYEDRRFVTKLSELKTAADNNTVSVVCADVASQEFFGHGPRRTLKIVIDDGSAAASMVCFGRNFLADKLQPGIKLLVYGSFSYRFNEIQTSSFEYRIMDPEQVSSLTENKNRRLPPDLFPDFGRILPVYPLSAGLNQKVLRKACAYAVKNLAAHIESEIPSRIAEANGLMDKPSALRAVHFPETPEEASAAVRTLKYEELFHLQTASAMRAAGRKRVTRPAVSIEGRLETQLLECLAFRLTEDQEKAAAEIKKDILSERPMARLLQGDVGSGKTLVAFISALSAVEAGGQAAFMAPTELLARQHAENAYRLLSPLGVRIALLTGSVNAEKKRNLLRSLADGTTDLVVGTHALFTENVAFRNLRLAVIDEQQRFGVMQRTALGSKGEAVDMLVMTATPIPRTLALTVFGDLDVSVIKTMPPGRKPVETHLAVHGNEQKVYDWVRKELEAGRQAYFVYPIIRNQGGSSLKDAEGMYKALSEKIYPDYKVSLLHSRIDENTKKEIMDSFRNGETQILAATSVVEVGVDVPNASCMVIEHAERFGLSALHQLRGRVGRGNCQSYAFLVYSRELTDEGKDRLRVMKSTADGFRIAEEDLRIRGPGNVGGEDQSGFLKLGIADLAADFELLKQARDDAFALAEKDPGLLLPEHAALGRLWRDCPPFGDTTSGG